MIPSHQIWELVTNSFLVINSEESAAHLARKFGISDTLIRDAGERQQMIEQLQQIQQMQQQQQMQQEQMQGEQQIAAE